MAAKSPAGRPLRRQVSSKSKTLLRGQRRVLYLGGLDQPTPGRRPASNGRLNGNLSLPSCGRASTHGSADSTWAACSSVGLALARLGRTSLNSGDPPGVLGGWQTTVPYPLPACYPAHFHHWLPARHITTVSLTAVHDLASDVLAAAAGGCPDLSYSLPGNRERSTLGAPGHKRSHIRPSFQRAVPAQEGGHSSNQLSRQKWQTFREGGQPGCRLCRCRRHYGQTC